ncbi:molybdopterin-dependent oxidoreductase, partial [candidate division WOR-3 bacterium]|nr:molybdopterin-dependent oxidoreductase [candidate division WOR-3 bacterium]
AEKLGRVPLDFKMDYALKTKDTTSTGGIIRGEVKLPEIIKEVEKMSDYRRKHKESRKFRGIGLSLFLHGCGFTGKGEESIKGKVTLRKKGKDVEILTSSVEMGQGATTTLRKIVSKSLSIPITQVLYDNPDTERVPDSGPTVASRTVMIVGGLLDSAAKELRERWDEGDEIEVSKIYKHPGYIKWDDKLLKGDAYPEYSWGANVVEVEIDPITYEIEVLGIWAVYDIGVAIDERIIQGQIEGGITQGLGYATIEVMDSVDGELVQRTLTDYKIPTSMDFPKIESKLVRNPYKYGPYGAKCAGELPFVGAAPALASAVENALSVPINRIPVTPEYLLEVLSG